MGRFVRLAAGDAFVGGLGSEIGRPVGRVALVFPPPLHAVAIKPSRVIATISRFIGRSLRGSNREASVDVRSNR